MFIYGQLNKTKMVSSLSVCCALALAIFSSTVAGILVGGIQEIDKVDLRDYSDLQKGLKVAEQKLNAESEIASAEFVFVPETIRASVQVVQGSLYRVTAKAAPDYCVTVNDLEKLADCEELSKTCSFKIWSRVWLPHPRDLMIQDWECPVN